jgi:hypothetical protein
LPWLNLVSYLQESPAFRHGEDVNLSYESVAFATIYLKLSPVKTRDGIGYGTVYIVVKKSFKEKDH